VGPCQRGVRPMLEWAAAGLAATGTYRCDFVCTNDGYTSMSAHKAVPPCCRDAAAERRRARRQVPRVNWSKTRPCWSMARTSSRVASPAISTKCKIEVAIAVKSAVPVGRSLAAPPETM
jgi:hypothetical protein